MVRDQHRPAELPVLAQGAVGVRQHRQPYAGRVRRADPVHDGPQAVTFVEMGAAEQDEGGDPVDEAGADLTRVPVGDRCQEAGHVGHGERGEGFAERSRGGSPPGAEHDECVVRRATGQLGDPVGGLPGHVVGVSHG